MESLAHGLLGAAAAITAKRKLVNLRLSAGWAVWWAVFPDALAFGLPVIVGVLMLLTGRPARFHGHLVLHADVGLPLYSIGHSLLVFALAFALAAILARRMWLAMLGWLMHILIDIPTHSFSYHATEFLWPVSGIRIDGIPWWTPWLWAATYALIAVVYAALWKKGWLSRARSSDSGARAEVRAGSSQ